MSDPGFEVGDLRAAAAWVDGDLVPWDDAVLHIRGAAKFAASGVFEGVRAFWVDSEEQLNVFRLNDHLLRLLESCRVMGLELGRSTRELSDDVSTYLRSAEVRGDVYVRISAFALGLSADFLDISDPASVVIEYWPSEPWRSGSNGLHVATSSWTKATESGGLYRIKSYSNYGHSRLAVLEAKRRGSNTPLLLNQLGHVTEGVGANYFHLYRGTVYTPPLTAGVLDGITRDTVIKLLRANGQVQVVEREIDRTEVFGADEAFFTGTSWGIVPIHSVDGLAIGTGATGQIVSDVTLAYQSLVSGSVDNWPDSWLTPIW